MRFRARHLWQSILPLSIAIAAASIPKLMMPQTATALQFAPNHDDDYAELSAAPEKARIRRNPLEHDEQAVAAGKKLFGQHCAECHGSKASGSDRAPSLRADEIREATPGILFWLLTNGVVRRGMPVWSKLPEAQRWQIVSYIQSLKATPPAEFR